MTTLRIYFASGDLIHYVSTPFLRLSLLELLRIFKILIALQIAVFRLIWKSADYEI